MPARGRSYTISRTGDVTLDGIQQTSKDTFDQLEDTRRGLAVGSVVSAPGALQLSEHMVGIYTGPGGHAWLLPAADMRGAARGQVLCLSNAGAGNLTVTASGNDMVNGATTLVLAAGASAILFSDGATSWRAVV